MTGRYSEPLYPDVGVVALVIDPWSEMFQLRHQIMTRLARYFRVVWVNPVHDWNHSVRAWKTRRALSRRPPAEYPGFSVYVPEVWLPRLSRYKMLADWTFEQRIKRARDLLIRNGCRKTILHIWNPEFAAAEDLKLFDVCVYHVDDEYSYSKVEVPIPEREVRLLQGADQVFMTSRSLMERKGRFNPHCDFIPNGVNYSSFSAPVAEPDDLAAIPHPRVGFSGYLTRHLDWPLVRWLAECRPDVQFVYVGAQKARVEVARAVAEMRQLPNVHFLGAKPWKELARYPQHFDVCTMPYEISGFTVYSYPLKLHEYLASGRPVIGSRLRALLEFDGPVLLPHTGEEWSQAIDRALGPEANSPEARHARQAVARAHDWEILTARVARRMAERLGMDDVARAIAGEQASPQRALAL
jgi:glycosyltransferase involved in cell wall biosynthesis